VLTTGTFGVSIVRSLLRGDLLRLLLRLVLPDLLRLCVSLKQFINIFYHPDKSLATKLEGLGEGKLSQ
jgi:hypothetical protein